MWRAIQTLRERKYHSLQETWCFWKCFLWKEWWSLVRRKISSKVHQAIRNSIESWWSSIQIGVTARVVAYSSSVPRVDVEEEYLGSLVGNSTSDSWVQQRFDLWRVSSGDSGLTSSSTPPKGIPIEKIFGVTTQQKNVRGRLRRWCGWLILIFSIFDSYLLYLLNSRTNFL